MKNPRIASLLALLMFLLPLAACSSAPPTGKAAPPGLRIVALDWRYEEMLVALGLTPAGIVAIGDSPEPTTLRGKLAGATSVGQAKQPNLEVIASLKPDLILASPTRHAQIMQQLRDIAPTEAYPDTSYDDVLTALDQVAQRTGRQAQAAEVRSRLEARLKQARATVKPGTRVVVAGWSRGSLYTWVERSFPATLLKAAGYEYAYGGDRTAIESKTDVAQLTGDKLPAMQVSRVFLYDDIAGFRASPFAAAAPAITEVDQDVWSRSRGPLAAEAMLDQVIAGP